MEYVSPRIPLLLWSSGFRKQQSLAAPRFHVWCNQLICRIFGLRINTKPPPAQHFQPFSTNISALFKSDALSSSNPPQRLSLPRCTKFVLRFFEPLAQSLAMISAKHPLPTQPAPAKVRLLRTLCWLDCAQLSRILQHPRTHARLSH